MACSKEHKSFFYEALGHAVHKEVPDLGDNSASMRRAVNGGIELAYDVEGSGPDLLLISGTASTRAIWSLVRPELARSYRTIAFDNRDSGESSLARAPYRAADLVADTLAVLDAAESARAHVIGHSMGGIVATELALAYPERIASLTLANTWARGDAYAANAIGLLNALTAHIGDDRTLLASIIFAGAGTTTLGAGSLWDMTDAAMALGPLAPRAALQRQWAFDLTADTLDRVASLAMPVHVIWGEEDRLTPPSLARTLLEAIPGAAGTPIAACGHVPMVHAPQAFLAAVAAFLERFA